MIAQAWLGVAGLVFDFFGVMLLAWEWRLALTADEREAEREAHARRLTPSPMLPRPGGPQQAVFDHMRSQMQAEQRARRAGANRGSRRGWFTAAMVLIAIGFGLQLLGTLPGCCTAIGIRPSG
jgi:hypothetical protein